MCSEYKNNGEVRKRLFFSGIVQGVGFRPTVYRCAVGLGLTGFVQNRRSVVVAEVQGSEPAVGSFRAELESMLPEAARLDAVSEEELTPHLEDAFHIISSETSDYVFPPIPPDLAICEECRRELFDPRNRRYLYPFITCTQCGPRYSIVEDTPFDRETTSMLDFPQCPECLQEYENPMDRRFHSQTNSCSRCGPELLLRGPSGGAVSGDPVLGTIDALLDGKVVAIQGIGGFHLAVDPSCREGMERLRRDKERERKPFALMVRDLEEAERLCRLSDEDRRVLLSPESPIVIAPVRSQPGGRRPPEYIGQVSDIGTLGIMLPYTPLHLLLFFHPERDITYGHLVMTSGNPKGEPIVTGPEEALEKLAPVADLFLSHNRRIIFRTDDSIVRTGRGACTGPTVASPPRTGGPTPNCGEPGSRPPTPNCGGSGFQVLLRRSRGYVPGLIKTAAPMEQITLATGGDLKNAPALASGNDIYLCPYIGDVENQVTYEAFTSQIEQVLSLYGITPERIVCDLHPGYLSTRWALEQEGKEIVQVQHHYAHILSVMAEHDLEEVLGLSFDGTGYGTDGTIWGGEFLHARRESFERLGSFAPFLLPGGEAAVRHPRRIAFALLATEGTQETAELLGLDSREREILPEMIAGGINSPVTTSLGRLFDAAAAILGLVETVGYEGEGPMKLEGRALRASGVQAGGEDTASGEETCPAELIPLEWRDGGASRQGSFRLQPLPLLRRLARDRGRVSTDELALLFHRAVASAALRGAVAMRETTGIGSVALSGGVFQNMLLVDLLLPLLEQEGFTVYTNQVVPPGDGGIGVGQAFYRS
jgi:hydrogenase maturation protein HypF